MKLQMGEGKHMRRQTNTKGHHQANAGARDVHQVVGETTKGGRRPEESKLFQKKNKKKTGNQPDRTTVRSFLLSILIAFF